MTPEEIEFGMSAEALRARCADLRRQRDDAEGRLLRARKVALDGIAARHMVRSAWTHRLLLKIVAIIENKESAI